MRKVIALWMYRNDGGYVIQDKLKGMLEEKGITVINDFDMRECYCLDGHIYTDNGFDLSRVDLFYHMNADEQTSYQNDLLHALELSGVRVVNGWLAFSTAKDKFMTNVLLSRHGIDVPEAIFVNKKQAISMAPEIFKRFKVICVKPRTYHAGKGIVMIKNEEEFVDFVWATAPCFESYYIERFIPFKDHDFRVEVLRGKLVGGYGRAKKHSFKTNIVFGGHFIEVDIPKECKEISLKAANILEIDTTITDIVRSEEDGKYYVLEVNPIMGIFVESLIKYGTKSTVKEIHNGYAYDKYKLKALSDFLCAMLK